MNCSIHLRVSTTFWVSNFKGFRNIMLLAKRVVPIQKNQFYASTTADKHCFWWNGQLTYLNSCRIAVVKSAPVYSTADKFALCGVPIGNTFPISRFSCRLTAFSKWLNAIRNYAWWQKLEHSAVPSTVLKTRFHISVIVRNAGQYLSHQQTIPVFWVS